MAKKKEGPEMAPYPYIEDPETHTFNRLIKADTVYDAWRGINDLFIHDDSEDAMVMAGRAFSIVRYHVTLQATQGFGLPEFENMPPFFNPSRRLKTLENRYVDPKFWVPGIERMLERRSRITGSSPSTSMILFNRRETTERGIPAGGGCLISLNFTWFKKHWHVHIMSRASEITARLLSDAYFVRDMIERAAEEAQLKKWDPNTLHVTWTLLLPSQMKYMVPLYKLYLEGEEAVKELMLAKPTTKWGEVYVHHFWDEFIFPEKIKWMQRKRWSDKFLEATSIDWPSLVPEQYKGGKAK